MNKKAIFLAKRLDRIAPECDRRRIAAGGVLAILCAAIAATVLSLVLCNVQNVRAVYTVLLCCGFLSQLLSLPLLIKETIRNRFYSAVWFLILSILTTTALIVAAVLCAIY